MKTNNTCVHEHTKIVYTPTQNVHCIVLPHVGSTAGKAHSKRPQSASQPRRLRPHSSSHVGRASAKRIHNRPSSAGMGARSSSAATVGFGSHLPASREEDKRGRRGQGKPGSAGHSRSSISPSRDAHFSLSGSNFVGHGVSAPHQCSAADELACVMCALALLDSGWPHFAVAHSHHVFVSCFFDNTTTQFRSGPWSEWLAVPSTSGSAGGFSPGTARDARNCIRVLLAAVYG